MHEKLQYRDSYAMAAFVDAAKVLFFSTDLVRNSNHLPKTIRYDRLRPH